MSYTIRIEQDTDPMNPRKEFDNFGEMLCLHKRYNLGDKHEYRSGDFSGWDKFRDALETEDDRAEVVLPLYLYDHSGITMRTAPFYCPWDSGQVGFIVARRSKILQEFNKKRLSAALIDKIMQILKNEVETYDQYLTGDVWGYVIEDEKGEHVDSCWGFYGRDYCEQEAQQSVKALEKRDAEQLAERKRVYGMIPCCEA